MNRGSYTKEDFIIKVDRFLRGKNIKIRRDKIDAETLKLMKSSYTEEEYHVIECLFLISNQ